MAIRPYGRNLPRPCPIIDHPKVLRTLARKYGARPTHEGAESILTELAPHLDCYAEGLRRVYDPVFAAEYRWAAQLHSRPEYDLVLHPPRDLAVEVPVEADAPALR